MNKDTVAPRILLVDDEPDITLSFKAMLEQRGFKVDTFNNPLTAIEGFKPGVYDLLLLDIRMLEMDGFKLYDELKKLDKEVKVYLSTIIDVMGIYVPETDNEILVYYSLAAINGVIGGILFAIPFRNMAKTLRKDDSTRKYMMTTAFGFLISFVALSDSVFVAPYPPFGFAAQAIFLLSTYMIFIGLFSTAVSMSQSMNLRQSISALHYQKQIF